MTLKDLKEAMKYTLNWEFQTLHSIEKESDVIKKTIMAVDHLGDINSSYDDRRDYNVDLIFDGRVGKVTGYEWTVYAGRMLNTTYYVYLNTYDRELWTEACIEDKYVTFKRRLSKRICNFFNKCIEKRVSGILDVKTFEKRRQEDFAACEKLLDSGMFPVTLSIGMPTYVIWELGEALDEELKEVGLTEAV